MTRGSYQEPSGAFPPSMLGRGRRDGGWKLSFVSESFLAYVFVPHIGVCFDVLGEHLHAFV